jgi:hypothetical protein
MRYLISAVAVLAIAMSFGCGASDPGQTSQLDQAVVQSCAATADCTAFAASQCLSTQMGACAQAGTASAHCVCVTVHNPSNPGNPSLPGPTCWEIRNDCVDSCEPGDWDCEDGCYMEWGACGG